MSAPRVRARYVGGGLLLAAVAPAGALALRWLAAAGPGAFGAFAAREWAANRLLYLYLTVGPLAVLGAAAWLAGTYADRLAALARRLEGMAMRDPVTGLFNRRYMERRLASEISRAERVRRPLACLLVRMTGHGGWSTGRVEPGPDPVLCDLAFTLKTTCREPDILGRLDRDAFMVILPETDLYNAWIVATRILDAVVTGRFTLRGQEVPVAVNIGGAEVDREIRWNAQLLEAARDALDRASAEGPNRAILHDPASRRAAGAPHGDPSAHAPA